LQYALKHLSKEICKDSSLSSSCHK